ncbi:related to transcription factor NUC-1 [Rhynchosporium graminicola]|uniref:Related to transcription factor NUC-1 n=1 Tax=Rhynchosporium graminicola TaxID=2792576 RepID=A0A1E1K9H3_9HELO|nr:related to transcription factor NUC-1 [Rhynchosporium commune]
MNTSTGWDGQDQTLSTAQDDFQQFLDLGINGLGDGLQFDFPEFNQQGAQIMVQTGGDNMDTAMGNGNQGMGQDTTMQEHMPAMTVASNHQSIHGPAIMKGHASNESLSELDAQIQYLQHQRHEQQQRQIQEQQRNFYAQSGMIPPTPNSLEMHGGGAHYYTQPDAQQQAMYDRYQRQMKENEMAFTPLVSPAVTPLDPHFSIPDYTVPGAYFSPLSSPALHAQADHSSVYDHRLSGATNLPIDTTQDTHCGPASSVILARKPGKKASQQGSKPRSTRAVRQSPIVKPKKGRKNTITVVPAQALGDILEPSHAQVKRSKVDSSSQSVASTEESENGSISPEHLSDMAPPPLPSPAIASPHMQAQQVRGQKSVLCSPATPASLMRLAQSPQIGQPGSTQHMDLDDPGMDGFALPESATARPQLSRLDMQDDGQLTPTLSSTDAKTPGFQPLPSPSFTRPGTASQSPQIYAQNGTNGTSTTTRKTPLLNSRSSKKRASSSVLVSPALLPRISPSIKPLLPGGSNGNGDTASLLLAASKSNYQNILEGTHLPGVSYPTELSTNLTSKRTSHKIAEQGRRNRINSALQEIATLLPRGSKDSGGEKSGSGDAGDTHEVASAKSAAQSANSKASTVEQAIEYIKQLKKDIANANLRAEEAERLLKEKVGEDIKF